MHFVCVVGLCLWQLVHQGSLNYIGLQVIAFLSISLECTNAQIVFIANTCKLNYGHSENIVLLDVYLITAWYYSVTTCLLNTADNVPNQWECGTLAFISPALDVMNS